MCSCMTMIGDDYVRCPMCGFVRKPYVKERSVPQYIMSFFYAESQAKKVGNNGKHRKNARGMHIVDPYLNHRSMTQRT